MAVVRSRAVVIVEIDCAKPPSGNDWSAGPLPVAFGAKFTTRDVRATYFHKRVADILYGPEDHPHRWWRSVPVTPFGLGASISSVEIVAPPLKATRHGRRAIAALHVDLGSDPVTTLASISRLTDNPAQSAAGNASTINSLLDGVASVAIGFQRTFLMSLVTSAIGLEPLPDSGAPSSKPVTWTDLDAWLWLLASANSFETFCPDPDATDTLGQRIRLSAKWTALALRDGLAFLGVAPDLGELDSFFPHGDVYFQSIYADVAILAQIQRWNLEALADRLADLGSSFSNAQEFSRLQQDFIRFKSVYWWEHLSSHGTGNAVLSALQIEYRLPELVERVSQDLSDHYQQIETSTTIRTSALLGIVTLIGLPLGLVVSAATSVETNGWKPVLWFLGFAILLTIPLLLTSVGRSMFSPLWRRHQRSDEE